MVSTRSIFVGDFRIFTCAIIGKKRRRIKPARRREMQRKEKGRKEILLFSPYLLFYFSRRLGGLIIFTN